MTSPKKNILIVDDDVFIQETIKEILESEGYTIHLATNGVEGLKIFADEEIHLIVLDLMMPRMDGYMFMERLNLICQQAPTAKLRPPVLILTAVNYNKDLGLSHNLGAVQYVEKPYRKDELLEKIKTALAGAEKV